MAYLHSVKPSWYAQWETDEVWNLIAGAKDLERLSADTPGRPLSLSTGRGGGGGKWGKFKKFKGSGSASSDSSNDSQQESGTGTGQNSGGRGLTEARGLARRFREAVELSDSDDDFGKDYEHDDDFGQDSDEEDEDELLDEDVWGSWGGAGANHVAGSAWAGASHSQLSSFGKLPMQNESTMARRILHEFKTASARGSPKGIQSAVDVQKLSFGPYTSGGP